MARTNCIQDSEYKRRRAAGLARGETWDASDWIPAYSTFHNRDTGETKVLSMSTGQIAYTRYENHPDESSDDEGSTIVVAPRPKPPPLDAMLKFPDEVFLRIFSHLNFSDQVWVSATMTTNGEWRFVEEKEKDIVRSKKQKKVLAKKSPASQHKILRSVCRKFKLIADDVHASEALFCLRVHNHTNAPKRSLLLKKTPVPHDIIARLRHAEIEMSIPVGTIQTIGRFMPQIVSWNLSSRKCVFQIHTRPELSIRCTQSPAEDYYHNKGQLSENSREIAGAYVKAVLRKGAGILKGSDGGRGWVKPLLELMTLGMDLSRKHGGSEGRTAHMDAVNAEIKRLVGEVGEEEEVS